MTKIGKIMPGDEEMHRGLAHWKKYLTMRIRKNKNFLGAFIGETGSGKSYSVLSLIEILTGKPVNFADVFMDSAGFINRLDEILEKGRDKRELCVLLWDEAGKSLNAKQWQNKMNKIINIILQVFRSENIIVFFTIPFFTFLDSDARKLMHGMFEMEQIDLSTKETVVKPFLIQTNQRSGKSYVKYLRVIDDKEGLIPVERIKIPMPCQQTIEEYEKRKKIFVRDIVKEAKSTVESVNNVGNPSKLGRPLTDFERETWELDQEGKTNREISHIQRISERMVAKTLKSCREKLGIGDTTQK